MDAGVGIEPTALPLCRRLPWASRAPGEKQRQTIFPASGKWSGNIGATGRTRTRDTQGRSLVFYSN